MDWQVMAMISTFWAAGATVFAAMAHNDYKWWRANSSRWQTLSREWQTMATRELERRSVNSPHEDGSNQIN